MPSSKQGWQLSNDDTMTVQEMHISVDQGLQKVGSFIFDNFLPDEIDHALNKMQERFIKERIFDRGIPYRQGFSETQKRLDDVQVIVVSDWSPTIPGLPDTGKISVAIPSDYLFLVNVRVLVGDCDPSREEPARVVQQDKLYELEKNPFAWSRKDSPIVTLADNQLTIHGKRFIVEGLIADYIRKPNVISLSNNADCELAEHTHSEIVDLTVKHLLEATESQRYQTNLNESASTE